MYPSRWGRHLGVVCLLGLVFLWSCRREAPSNFDSNIPPETIITGAPAESTLSFYQVRIFWYGDDPDGQIDHFEYSVTDSNKTPGEDDPGFSGYFRTTKTDSLFKLTADQPQILGHRFYVRAVDNEGKFDPSPAWTYFVAHDFNFPNVVYNAVKATWRDRAGNQRVFDLTSNDPGNPSDTIGVGGSVTASWTGFDVDPGGFVTGYEFRTSQDQGFRGGTLADTTHTISFAQPAGAALDAYFTGRELLQVRAIDDAGAKTSPDSARSFVVGFAPLTWIVDPNQVNPPARKRVFTDKDTGQLWPTGTVLADATSGRNLEFKYTGFDDPRDMSLDPNNPSGIIGFEYRRLANGGGLAFRKLQDWSAFPLVSDFLLSEANNLRSGDYLFLVRAVDELGRKGKAETLAVGVNYSPYFEWVRYVGSDSTEYPLWNPDPSGGLETVVLQEQSGGGYADLLVRYSGVDNHFPPPDTDPLDPNVVVETELGRVSDYMVRLNDARNGFEDAPIDSAGEPLPGEKFFVVSTEGGTGVIRPGLNELELRVKDLSGRVAQLSVFFNVQLQ